MALTTDQVAEIQKFQKVIEQLEKIHKLSSNPEQKSRVAKDLFKYKEKLRTITPTSEISTTTTINIQPKTATAKQLSTKKDASFLSQFTIMKISPNSNDNEINLIGTLLNVLDTEFIPILMDTHIKFDFSHAAERDGVVKYMENIRRNIKVLTETIEEHAQTDKQEFREQLGRMKNKQARIFITEAYEVFKNFEGFLEKILTDMGTGGGVIMNLEDPIKFNSRFEKATLLEGKSIEESINIFHSFLEEAIQNINIPNLKK